VEDRKKNSLGKALERLGGGGGWKKFFVVGFSEPGVKRVGITEEGKTSEGKGDKTPFGRKARLRRWCKSVERGVGKNFKV